MPDHSPRQMSFMPPVSEQVRALVSYLEHDPQPSIVLDTRYRILAANAAYRRQFGVEGSAPIGRTCHEVSHGYSAPCDQSGEHCPMRRALESKGPDRVLHIHHTPRGPEHVDVELRPVLDTDGQVMAFVERMSTVRHAAAAAHGQALVGRAPAFNKALAAVQRVARSSLPVLLLGESGSGKELFARAVHEASDRSRGPFVVVDCSGLAEPLLESELFGFEKGAFTGAVARKAGLVETAEGGTLFLDEMGDVPLSVQVKLLRLIETRTYRRVGGLETRQADFRLVAATHKPLRAMVDQGQFRQDLYYRIAAFPIELPPLRTRPQDIELLAETFLRRAATQGAGTPRLTPQALQRMQAHDWPGNVRELRHVLERALLYADDGQIRPEHLPDGLGASVGDGDQSALSTTPADMSATDAQHSLAVADVGPDPVLAREKTDGGITLRRSSRRVSVSAVAALAQTFPGTRQELASLLGVSERTLFRRLRAAAQVPAGALASEGPVKQVASAPASAAPPGTIGRSTAPADATTHHTTTVRSR